MMAAKSHRCWQGRVARPISLGIIAAIPEELWQLRCGAPIKKIRGDGRQLEQRTLGGRLTWLLAGGDGLRNADGGIRLLIKHHQVGPLLGLGIAGAATAGLKQGDLIVSESVSGPDGGSYTADRELIELAQKVDHKIRRGQIVSVVDPAGPDQKRLLASQHAGVLAVDMESFSWLKAAGDARRQMLIVRCIFDPVDEPLPDYVIAASRGQYGINRRKLLSYAITHPSCWRQLVSFRKRMDQCSRRLAEFVRAFVTQLS